MVKILLTLWSFVNYFIILLLLLTFLSNLLSKRTVYSGLKSSGEKLLGSSRKDVVNVVVLDEYVE